MQVIRIHEQVRLHTGYLRGIAYDLPRSAHHFLPKELVSTLIESQGVPLSTIEKRVRQAGINLFDWLELLEKEELIFECPAAFSNNFPKIDLVVERPLLIDTAVLPLSLARPDVLRVLEEAGCQHIAVRMIARNKGLLRSFWQTMESISITSVSIHLDEEVSPSLIATLIPERELSPKLRFVSMKGSDINPRFSGDVSLHQVPDRSSSGRYEPCLTLNQEVYMDALRWNVYYNRKIFIDEKGRIGPGVNRSSIYSTPKALATALSEHLNTMGKPALWSVKKDDVTVCKDCELKYMCVDPRVPDQRGNGTYFYKEECAYNPYISKWQDEVGYRGLPECGITNDSKGFTVDHQRIAAINSKLWDE